MLKPVLVQIIEGVVSSVTICKDADEMETMFTKILSDRGIESCDAHFDDGYFEFEDNSTVCMTWGDQNE